VEYFLIVFVIFLALAPLTHFIPSKRQRLVARLRETAAVSGLFVEYRSPPEKGKRQHKGGALIYYGKRLPNTRGASIERMAWLRDDWGWRGLDKPADTPEVLPTLPEEIIIATVDEGSCGVYWDEDGGEEVLVEICRVLEAWSDQLRPQKSDFA